MSRGNWIFWVEFGWNDGYGAYTKNVDVNCMSDIDRD